MPRYPHLIGKATKYHWPSSVLCLATETATVGGESNGGPTRSELVKCAGAFTRLRTVGGFDVRQLAANRPKDFWDALNDLTYYYGPLFVVSEHAAQDFAVLGLWDQICDGEVSLTDSDWTFADARDKANREMRLKQKDPLRVPSSAAISDFISRKHGYLVLEDPPTIAKFKLLASGKDVTWVDCRNYGVSVPSDTTNAVQRAQWLSEWMASYRQCSKAYSLGSLCNTSGSQSMQAFRFGHWEPGMFAHANQEILQLESESYHGGRSEVLRLGKADTLLHVLDVRSLYPAICVDCELPISPIEYVECDSLERVEPPEEPLSCIARVKIECQEPNYPVRQWRDSKTGTMTREPIPYKSGLRSYSEVIYPTGRFYATLAGPELDDAINSGCVVETLSYARYEMRHALYHYATNLYRLRCDAAKESNTGMLQMAKQLLVCLPGKFAQRDRKWVLDHEEMPLEMYGDWSGCDERGNLIHYRAIGGVVFREEVDGFAADAVPSVASWITSEGRVRLLTAIRLARWEHVYYCDTDCVMVDEFGYRELKSHNMISDGELGKFEVRARSINVNIYGIKMYSIDGKLTCAGLPTKTVKLDNGSATYQRDRSIKDQLRNREVPQAVQELISFRQQGERYRGRTEADGRITPVHLCDW